MPSTILTPFPGAHRIHRFLRSRVHRQTKNETAYSAAQNVMRHCSDRLQPVLSELLSAGESIAEGMFANRAQVAELVYELHLIHPSLLLYIMPTVCRDLNVRYCASPCPHRARTSAWCGFNHQRAGC